MADRLEFDSVTRALLSELQKDARQTNKALAEKVGLAPSTCLERVRELPPAA
jgi:DNA-binding Lrp family transcriptional regulator